MEISELKKRLWDLPELYATQGIQTENAYLLYKQAELDMENQYHHNLLTIKLEGGKMTLAELEAKVEVGLFNAKLEALKKESDYRQQKVKLDKIGHEIVLACKLASLADREIGMGLHSDELPMRRS